MLLEARFDFVFDVFCLSLYLAHASLSKVCGSSSAAAYVHSSLFRIA